MIKKSRIRETPTLSTNAVSRTNTNLKSLRDLSLKKKQCSPVGSVQFCAVQCSAVQCSAVQSSRFSSVLCSAVQCRAGGYGRYSSAEYSNHGPAIVSPVYSGPHIITLQCNALHCTALHYTVLHFTALNLTALKCTALHCTELNCTFLHSSASRSPRVQCSLVMWSPCSGGRLSSYLHSRLLLNTLLHALQCMQSIHALPLFTCLPFLNQ